MFIYHTANVSTDVDYYYYKFANELTIQSNQINNFQLLSVCTIRFKRCCSNIKLLFKKTIANESNINLFVTFLSILSLKCIDYKNKYGVTLYQKLVIGILLFCT